MKISTRVLLAWTVGTFAAALVGAGPATGFAQSGKPNASAPNASAPKASAQSAPGQKSGAPAQPAGQAGAQGKGGQAGQAGGQAPGSQAPAGQAAVGPQITPAESSAYQAIQTEMNAGLDPDKVISLSQDFEKKFPNSPMLSYVYTFEATGYQQKGDIKNVIEAGEKSLKLNADNLMSLIVVASMLPQPQMMQGNELDKQKKLSEAETYANHAIELIDKLPKPPNEADDVFKKRKNAIISEPRAALGMVHLQRASMGLTGMDPDELAKAAQEFKSSVELAEHPAPQAYYRLGEVYVHENKIADAIGAFSKASELGQGTGIQQYADTQIEVLKKRQALGKPPASK